MSSIILKYYVFGPCTDPQSDKTYWLVRRRTGEKQDEPIGYYATRAYAREHCKHCNTVDPTDGETR